MKKLLIINFILLVFVVSCSRATYDKQTYSHIPDVIKIVGTPITLPDSIFFAYPQMKIKDSLCCIWDQSFQKKHFHIFTFPGFEYIYSLAHVGRGYNEIIQPGDFDLTTHYLYAYDLNLKKLYSYDVKNRASKPNECIDYNMLKLYDAQRFCMIGDSLAAFYTTNIQNIIYIIDKKGNMMDSLLKRPLLNDWNYHMISSSWNSCISFLHGNIVCATISAEVIDVVNISNKKHRIFVGPGGKPRPLQRGNSFLPVSFFGFQNIFLTDNYIYTLFSGMTWDEYREKSKAKQNTDKNYIRVYDYNGNLINVYDTDENLLSIYVDESANKIYATVYDNENSIYVYEMPNI